MRRACLARCGALLAINGPCDLGATVRFATEAALSHVAGAVRSYPEAFAVLEARFAGRAAASSCWRLQT